MDRLGLRVGVMFHVKHLGWLLLLAGCSDWFNPQEYETAQRLCTDHGGVDYVWVRSGVERFTVWAVCNDGVEVRSREAFRAKK